MRNRTPLCFTSGYLRVRHLASAGACLAMALLPGVWVSWWAPVARGVALPALAILSLLFLPRSSAGTPANRQPSAEGDGAGSPRGWTCLLSGLTRCVRALLACPALLYLGWAGVCAARASTAHLPGAAEFARGELLRITAGIALYLVVASTACRWERARQTVDALLCAAITVSVMAFVTHRAEDPALVGPFGNTQLLASTMMLLVPFALVVGTTARNRMRRLLAQVSVVLALAALALTQTRSAWLGGLGALLALAFFLARLPHRRRRRWTHRSSTLRPAGGALVGGPPLAAGLLALAAVAWLVCHSDLVGPLSARVGTLARLSDDEGANWRLRQWRVAINLTREHPWAGIGLGSYPLAAASRLPQPIPLAVARRVGPNLSLNAHSFYLQSLTEMGAVGLGLYLWTVVGFVVTGWRASRRRDAPYRSLVLVACLAAVIGQAVDALANPAYQFAEVSFLFWAILGLGTAMAQRPSRSEQTTEAVGDAVAAGSGQGQHRMAPPSPGVLPAPLRWAAALTGLGVLFGSAVAGSPPPLNSAEYMPLRSFRVTALTTPGYLVQTLLPGECVEMRGLGTLSTGTEERDTTPECTFTRAGGTAPPDALEQLPAPNANLFCLPTSVPPEYDGRTVMIQGTFSFNGQTLSALGPPICLSVPRAAPGTRLVATPRVISPTDQMVEIQVKIVAGSLHLQRLWKVDANEALAAGDVQILDDTHVMLRASSTTPGVRIYTLRYRFRDATNRTWVAPVQVYVR